MVFLFLFAVGVLAPVVHNLCTLGFFWFLYKVAFYRSKKKKKRMLWELVLAIFGASWVFLFPFTRP